MFGGHWRQVALIGNQDWEMPWVPTVVPVQGRTGPQIPQVALQGTSLIWAPSVFLLWQAQPRAGSGHSCPLRGKQFLGPLWQNLGL